MAEPTAGKNASNAHASMNTDASKTSSPAARKFAEYLARRMGPMVQHAARNNVHTPVVNNDA